MGGAGRPGGVVLLQGVGVLNWNVEVIFLACHMWREGGRKGGKEGGREGGKEGGRASIIIVVCVVCTWCGPSDDVTSLGVENEKLGSGGSVTMTTPEVVGDFRG